MTQALEQMLELAPTIEQESRAYQTLDVYTGGLSRMYIGPRGIIEPMTPIGSMGSGFQLGGNGVLRKDLSYGLQERYDFSGHNGTGPHLNYDLLDANKEFSKRNLGDAHYIDLFKK